MREHVRQECTDEECEGSCNICNLFVCAVCHLFEGSLTTECPGVIAFHDWADKVYNDGWDYKNGDWVLDPEHPGGFRASRMVKK